jgi:hypothetical protein
MLTYSNTIKTIRHNDGHTHSRQLQYTNRTAMDNTSHSPHFQIIHPFSYSCVNFIVRVWPISFVYSGTSLASRWKYLTEFESPESYRCLTVERMTRYLNFPTQKSSIYDQLS